MGKQKPTIGRTKNNRMPIAWKGVTFHVPLSKRIYGKNCREYSFSSTKANAKSIRDKLRKKGDTAYVKTFTVSDEKNPKYKKTIHVVYRRKK